MSRFYLLVSLTICFSALFSQSYMFAENPATWNISESTTGQDVFWTSPTAVDLGLPRYYTSFEITRVEAFTILGGTDVTDQLEVTTGDGIFDSLPVTLIDAMLDEPATGTTVTVFVEIDGNGFAQSSFTDVILGTVIFLPITQIDVDTTITVLGLVPGDFDSNFVVNSVDYSDWESSFGINAGADTDFDGDSDGIDFLDWQQYFGSDYSAGPAIAITVPEPATAASIAIAAICLLATSARRRKEE